MPLIRQLSSQKFDVYIVLDFCRIITLQLTVQFLGHEEQKFIGKYVLDKFGPPLFKLKCPVYGA